MKTMLTALFVVAIIFLATAASPVSTDPYQHVVFVTNTVAWPYNPVTFGVDSFQLGGEDNEDTKLLNEVRQQGFHFSENFGFSVAGSAYQYEGHRVAPSLKNPDGIGWSMWDVFSEKSSWLNPKGRNIAEVLPTSRYTLPNGQNAIKGYEARYNDEDIKLIQELGVGYYRLSVSWPRLFPRPGMSEPDPEGVKYYVDALKKLQKAHIKVMLTLYHWDLPAWLYNFGDSTIKPADKTYGWLDMRPAKDNITLKEFQKYVVASYKAFGPYTSSIATFNEPWTFTVSAFVEGVHAPGQYGWELLQKTNPELYGKSFDEYLERVPYLQAINIIKAHYIGYKAIHDVYAQDPKRYSEAPEVGIVLNSDWAEPYRMQCALKGECQYHPDDIQASKNNMDFMLGWWLHPVMFGSWPQSMQFIYNDRIQSVGLQATREDSCLEAGGLPVSCTAGEHPVTLAAYIAEGGALDAIMLNHYTGYFIVDMKYATSHFSKANVNDAVPPNQYGASPADLKPGYYRDQQAFMTQFRYQKYGDQGHAPGDAKAYIIGNAGNKPWLRQTWFVYRKLLQYIHFYYMNSVETGQPSVTKMGKSFKDLDIYLTENGTSIYQESQTDNLNDMNRIQYLVGNLAAVQQAVTLDHLNIKVYTYWSVADNFEWSEGYDTRFGLVSINYQDDFKRTPKQSYYCFKEIIAHKTQGIFPKECSDAIK